MQHPHTNCTEFPALPSLRINSTAIHMHPATSYVRIDLYREQVCIATVVKEAQEVLTKEQMAGVESVHLRLVHAPHSLLHLMHLLHLQKCDLVLRHLLQTSRQL